MSNKVRRRLKEVLKTDADMNAFCIDEFPDVHRQFTQGLILTEKINLLFEIAGAEAVERALEGWTSGSGSRLEATSKTVPARRDRLITALVLVSGLSVATMISVLVVALTRDARPTIIIVPPSEIEHQLSAQGVGRRDFDPPERFAEEVQKAGPQNVRYEVSVDTDRETKELMRLVLALLIRSNRLIAATKYPALREQPWQRGITPQARMFADLANSIEGKLKTESRLDLASSQTSDMASHSLDDTVPLINSDLTVPQVDMAKAIPSLSEYRPRMVPLPPGLFWMGSPEGEGDPDEHPRHEVVISHGFLISESEVTQGQYKSVTGNNPSAFSDKAIKANPYANLKHQVLDWKNRPVENVTWFDAIQYCNRLSGLEKKKPCYIISDRQVKWNTRQTCTGYRLPTEAEWEYAAYAGHSTQYAGSEKIGEVAWFGTNSHQETNLVKTKKPNAWGLYDMSGNVREWVWDCYFSYSEARVTNPIGPLDCSDRVDRGGSWANALEYARIANRDVVPASVSSQELGFRIVRATP